MNTECKEEKIERRVLRAKFHRSQQILCGLMPTQEETSQLKMKAK